MGPESKHGAPNLDMPGVRKCDWVSLLSSPAENFPDRLKLFLSFFVLWLSRASERATNSDKQRHPATSSDISFFVFWLSRASDKQRHPATSSDIQRQTATTTENDLPRPAARTLGGSPYAGRLCALILSPSYRSYLTYLLTRRQISPSPPSHGALHQLSRSYRFGITA